VVDRRDLVVDRRDLVVDRRDLVVDRRDLVVVCHMPRCEPRRSLGRCRRSSNGGLTFYSTVQEIFCWWSDVLFDGAGDRLGWV